MRTMSERVFIVRLMIVRHVELEIDDAVSRGDAISIARERACCTAEDEVHVDMCWPTSRRSEGNDAQLAFALGERVS